MIYDDGAVITSNYSNTLDGVIGKISILDTPRAKTLWTLFRKNPTMFKFEVGYIENTDGTKELLEITLVTKHESK